MADDRPIAWVLEDPDDHFREHDARQVRYWLSRPPAERLAQAARYRIRVHGDVEAPAVFSWRLIDGWGER